MNRHSYLKGYMLYTDYVVCVLMQFVATYPRICMNRPDVAEKHLFVISIITELHNSSCPRRMESFNFCPVELEKEMFKVRKCSLKYHKQLKTLHFYIRTVRVHKMV